jgi:hypothetical protein
VRSWNRRDGRCPLSGSLPGEPRGYLRQTPVRHSSANLAGASFSPRFAPAIFGPGERPSGQLGLSFKPVKWPARPFV